MTHGGEGDCQQDRAESRHLKAAASLITSQSGPEEIISSHITVTRPPSTHLELIRIFYTSCLLLDERSQVTSAKVDNYMGVSVRKFYAIKGSCLEGDN